MVIVSLFLYLNGIKVQKKRYGLYLGFIIICYVF